MKLVLGLLRPTNGTATINGKPFHELKSPLREVGALLDAKALHPGRSARNHLVALATSNKIPLSRVDEVLDIVGLSDVANKRAGQYSLGMGQRLGIAAAILGDPGVLMFDEPVNGLDPEGIRWVREFFRSLAAQGRTVLVSSHLMAEMQLTAETFVVVGKGHLITQGSEAELAKNAVQSVRVRVSDHAAFVRLADEQHWRMTSEADGSLEVAEASAEQIGRATLDAGIALSELTPLGANLEDIFIELTANAVQYSGKTSKDAQ
jgi:ABC-2 type transport system ATP-binding protein